MFKQIFQIITLLIVVAGSFSCNKTEIQAAVLTVTPDSISFQAEGGTADIQVTCNTTWTISTSSDWCVLPFQSSENNGKATIAISKNSTSEIRSAIVYLKADQLTREVKVLQKGIVPPIDTTSVTPIDTTTVPVDTISDNPDDEDPDAVGMRTIDAATFLKEMKAGWNLGNSLDAVGGETAWGNPKVTQQLIDSVKAAGFNAVRIPVAWSKFSDESNFTIDENWLKRVEEVVNYVLDDDMYAIINIHWDGGWMQPTYNKQEYVNTRLSIMWEQIANQFIDYGDHLLFAGTNEVMVDGNYGTPSKEYYTVQNSFNQTFVTTVRNTGGKNKYRYLVVQGFNTNIDYTVSYAAMPADIVEKRLLMEVHYYDPYDFTINESSKITQWGKDATDASKTETWANEAYADKQFNKMKTKFVDNGIPVIIGEYGAMARTSDADHAKYREYYMSYVTGSIYKHGLTPFYWDNGGTGNNGMGIFDRKTGKQAYPAIVKAIIDAVK
jgi:endoglucanase